VGSHRGETPEQICTISGSKCVKSAMDVPFEGFVKQFGVKNLTGSRILAVSAHAQQKIV